VLSSFTVDPLVPYLGWALEERDLSAEFKVAPYGQAARELVEPESQMAGFRPQVLVVWLRLEDLWAGQPVPLSDPADRYQKDLVEITRLALDAAAAWGSTLVCVLPAVPEMRPLGVGDACNTMGVFAVATAAREVVRTHVAAAPGAVVVDAEETIRLLGSGRALDPTREVTARVPYREEMFAEIGRRIGRVVLLERRGARKVVVVDADNTLWGDVVGEVGANGIDLLDNGPGEAYRAFQRYLLELRRAGLLIALASKNNEPDVWEAFGRREMVLQREHLAVSQVSWEPKSKTIAAMAAELNLGPDSVVFIDDSAMELAEVEAGLPGIATLAMPADPESWLDVILRSGKLDRLPPTEADQVRAVSYQDEAQRKRAKGSMSTQEFLQSLQLHVDIAQPDRGDLPRIAQLVAKTNQFTLGGTRHSESELALLLRQPRYSARIVSASDRFGAYGVIGAFLVDNSPDDKRLPGGVGLLDTFVLSCRAMGRGIEAAMVAAALEIVNGKLWAAVRETPKNVPGREFFTTLGAGLNEPRSLRVLEWPSHIHTTANCLCK
jgi:FkbH-like protein